MVLSSGLAGTAEPVLLAVSVAAARMARVERENDLMLVRPATRPEG
jgi:hypothetical protein